MSDIATIGGTGLAGLADNQSSAPTPVKSLPTTAPEDSLAVIVNIRNDPTVISANQPPTIHASANQVIDGLYLASGANALVDMDHELDWNRLAKFGAVIEAQNKAGYANAITSSTRIALSHLSGLGIPTQFTADPGAVSSGNTHGTISVGAFNFTDGTSSYTVRSDSNGKLIGTKDGQAWLTMQFSNFPEAKKPPAPAADAGSTSAPVAPVSQNLDQPAAISNLGTADTAAMRQVPEAPLEAANKAKSPSGGADEFTWLHHQEGWGEPARNDPVIPVQQAVGSGSIDDSSIKTTSAVKSFSFSHQGSVYSIGHASDGLLVGMKDGQRWDSWQAKSFASGKDQGSGVASALDTLTSTSIIASLAKAGAGPDRINVTV